MRCIMTVEPYTERQVLTENTGYHNIDMVECPFDGQKERPTMISTGYCNRRHCCFYAGRYESVADDVSYVLCGFSEARMNEVLELRKKALEKIKAEDDEPKFTLNGGGE